MNQRNKNRQNGKPLAHKKNQTDKKGNINVIVKMYFEYIWLEVQDSGSGIKKEKYQFKLSLSRIAFLKKYEMYKHYKLFHFLLKFGCINLQNIQN